MTRYCGGSEGRSRFKWEDLGVDEGGLPVHLPMPVTAEGQGPADPTDTDHYVCWCGHPQCPLTATFAEVAAAVTARTAPTTGRTYCGGCEGHGAHWRWCPEAVGPLAHHLGVMAEQAESLGDRVGPSEMGAANHLWAAASLLRAKARERRDEFQRKGESGG